MLEDILPECEVGEKRGEMILEIFTEEAFSLRVRLHLTVVG